MKKNNAVILDDILTIENLKCAYKEVMKTCKNKKIKYREKKRKLKYKKYLYETNRINLNSYLCSYINYR